MTPEPISRADIERWKMLAYESTGVSWSVALRLLAALEAGEALAQWLAVNTLDTKGHWWHCPGQQFHDRPEHDCHAIRECVALREALAAWHARVAG